jgi:hypothetical protein
MISVYGDAEYITLAGAENAAVLSTIPDIGEHATYVGRIVFEKSVTIADAVLSPFTVTLSTGGVTDHGSLSGLADDDHTQYALLNGRNGNILKIDDIQEYTDSHGVQIDDVLIQDRKVFPGGLYGMDVQGGNILALTSNNYIALDDSIRVLKGGSPAIVTTNSKNLYLYSTVASTGFTQISDNNNSQILKLWNSDKHIDASGPIEVLAHSVAGDSLTINGNSAGDSYMTLSRTASTDNIGFKFKTGSTQLWQLGSLSSQDDFKLINAATGNEAIQVNKSTNYVRLQYGMQLNNSAVTARYIYDEDDMSSNSNQALATQQSIKAYCENKGGRFNARMTSGVNDVTGDGTYYTCIFIGNLVLL